MVIIFSLGMKKTALGGFLSGSDESFQVQRLTLDGADCPKSGELHSTCPVVCIGFDQHIGWFSPTETDPKLPFTRGSNRPEADAQLASTDASGSITLSCSSATLAKSRSMLSVRFYKSLNRYDDPAPSHADILFHSEALDKVFSFKTGFFCDLASTAIPNDCASDHVP